MNSNKKIYLYSGLAIALSVVAYVVITRKKKLDTDPTKNNESTPQSDVTTQTGDVITSEQAVIDPTLQQILKLPLSQVKAKMKGKSLYSKIANINPRQSAYVNNGWFVNNSVGGRITEKDTFIGNVIDVENDKGSMQNSSGNVYKWFKINPSAEALRQIKEDSNILIGTNAKTFYVREDVVKLK
jgi:hypothetical protein